MISDRFKYSQNAKPCWPLPEGATDWIAEWNSTLAASEQSLQDAASPCGALPNENDAYLLATRDRYGFPVKTWLSKRSGIAWTSPQMNDDLASKFYSKFFQCIYRGQHDLISLRFAHQIERAMPLAKLALEHFGTSSLRDKVHLDIGCGSGGMLVPFIEFGADAHGFDVGGSNYLDLGKAVGLQIKQSDLSEMGKSNQKFNIITLAHVLEHISDPITFLQQTRSILSDGGILLIEVPGILNLKTYGNDFLRYLQNSHTHHYSGKSLTLLLKRVGFRIHSSSDVVRIVATKANTESELGWDSSHAQEILDHLISLENKFSGLSTPTPRANPLTKIYRRVQRLFTE